MTMKIVVCSPLNPHSAIGRVAVDTAHELAARNHTVSFISIELHQPSSFQVPADEVIFWKDDAATALLGAADMVVVHLGDNYSFHAGALHILKHWRCVGVFHDANIYGFFRMWCFDGRSDIDGRIHHDEMLSQLYEDFDGHVHSELDISIRFDMTIWLASQCSAALAHSLFYVPRLKAACPGPVFATPLTYRRRETHKIAAARSKAGLCILTIGHANANKCCDSVIEAIAGSACGQNIEYRIAGPASESEQTRLTALAHRHGVCLSLLGRVSDEALAHELDQADIVSCLRRPILEGASASVIEALLAAKPVIVVNGGFYADIADPAALKIPAEFTISDLTSAIDCLAASPSVRLEYGRRGRDWAATNCNVQTYVNVLEQTLREAVTVGPLLDLARSYMSELRSLGFDESDSAWLATADTLQSLISEPPTTF